MNANERKKDLLGMPFGTANGRLKKNLLFTFAQKLDMDTCFQCGEKITDIDTFSIEHKDSWMNSEDPVKAFFDLDNIAFSHASCNYNAAGKPTVQVRYNYRKSKTGYKGVYPMRNKFKAVIWMGDTSKHIGVFKTALEAAIAHDKYIKDNNLDVVTNESLGKLEPEG